ncbi:hypothetical protein [Lacticaseibacillus camelliae]|uniref:Uncharacterized protein n=1 Tax=Lacticaseibacillus camelliae DSM 22697 = JCM 13995 TaxID=1423730 RepID=A0A0R2FBW0_9LACO|nr:hypothetical protein [Lacticaseibacillus camelliae]KRN25897.1 hypothetical protein FC75_GL002031 [Lacticaseibacillus camelliae DSM 22697 = JCM 13995]
MSIIGIGTPEQAADKITQLLSKDPNLVQQAGANLAHVFYEAPLDKKHYDDCRRRLKQLYPKAERVGYIWAEINKSDNIIVVGSTYTHDLFETYELLKGNTLKKLAKAVLSDKENAALADYQSRINSAIAGAVIIPISPEKNLREAEQILGRRIIDTYGALNPNL